MAEHIMGIEIGSNTIKVIEIIKSATGLEVQKFSLIDTPPKCISNGQLKNMEIIKSILLNEIHDKKYKARKVVSVIQSSQIVIRKLVVDKQPEKLLKQNLETKVTQYLPVKKSHYQIDYKIIGEKEEKGKVKNEILLVAAPNTVVLPMIELIKSMRKIPILITIPSEALGFAFSKAQGILDETASHLMILDIGARTTAATVIVDEQAVITRCITFGVDDINERLSEVQVKEENENEAMYLQEVIYEQIKHNLIEEVERVLQFYYASFEEGFVEKIILIGGGANIKGIKKCISEALNIPVGGLGEFNGVTPKSGIEFEPYKRFFINILGAINGL